MDMQAATPAPQIGGSRYAMIAASVSQGMTGMKGIVGVAALLLCCVQGVEADSSDDQWPELIRQDFKPGCVLRMQPYWGLDANTGYAREDYYVETCEGSFEYRAEYFPPAMFPEKPQPTTVQRARKLPPMTPRQIKQAYFSRPDDSYPPADNPALRSGVPVSRH